MLQTFMRHTTAVLLIVILIAGCTKDRQKDRPQQPVRKVSVPSFNADSAFYFVEQQVEFGPRIPNTKAHRQTANFIVGHLKRHGAVVQVQEFESPSFEGERLSLRNIIASFFPDKKKRVLLAAHWDTRPFADKDSVNKTAKFDGANDGASGVGVLLEIARILAAEKSPDVGVDLIFFDGEDWGERHGEQDRVPLADGLEEWWCLGSQYWSKHKHKSGYSAYYSILVDMVGAKNAQFHKEGYSVEYAPSVTDKVWQTAASIGYSHVFVSQRQEAVMDDHYFVNTVAKIPAVDIIHFEPGGNYFGDFHHSQKDNLSIISKETLKAVGQTILTVLYREEP